MTVDPATPTAEHDDRCEQKIGGWTDCYCLSRALSSARAEAAGLRAEVERLTQRLAEKAEHIEIARRQRMRVKGDLAAAEDILAKVRAKWFEACETIVDARAEVARLTAERDAAQAQVQAVEACAQDFAALPNSNWRGHMIAATFRAALAAAQPTKETE